MLTSTLADIAGTPQEWSGGHAHYVPWNTQTVLRLSQAASGGLL